MNLKYCQDDSGIFVLFTRIYPRLGNFSDLIIGHIFQGAN
jgi:hypothetical protein